MGAGLALVQNNIRKFAKALKLKEIIDKAGYVNLILVSHSCTHIITCRIVIDLPILCLRLGLIETLGV